METLEFNPNLLHRKLSHTLEVREIGHNTPAIMHKCNDAIIETFKTEKEAKERLALLDAAPELLEACEIMELAFKNAPESWLMTLEVQNAAIFMREVVCLAKGYELINPKFH